MTVFWTCVRKYMLWTLRYKLIWGANKNTSHVHFLFRKISLLFLRHWWRAVVNHRHVSLKWFHQESTSYDEISTFFLKKLTLYYSMQLFIKVLKRVIFFFIKKMDVWGFVSLLRMFVCWCRSKGSHDMFGTDWFNYVDLWIHYIMRYGQWNEIVYNHPVAKRKSCCQFVYQKTIYTTFVT